MLPFVSAFVALFSLLDSKAIYHDWKYFLFGPVDEEAKGGMSFLGRLEVQLRYRPHLPLAPWRDRFYAVGQNQWYQFVYLSGNWDVHWGTGF